MFNLVEKNHNKFVTNYEEFFNYIKTLFKSME